MTKRTGLGKGLGAFFGDDYEVPAKKIKASEPMQENSQTVEEHIKNQQEHKIEKKPNLKELEMVLPTASRKKTEIKNKKNSSQIKKTVQKKPEVRIDKKLTEKVKIVEVEKEKFLNISLIEPNRSQPRKTFDEEQLNELAESIKSYGVLQPLIVQKKEDYYEIITGERRWRAAKLADLKEVPVILREYTKQQSMEIALIENVQREDLNPIEEAKAYQMLVQEFGLKQEEVAARVSKNRATITNSMRLLKLDQRVQEMLIQNRISGGHARALLALEEKDEQYQLAVRAVEQQLSVREIEKLVKALLSEPKKRKVQKEEERDLSLFYHKLEEQLKSLMGTKVTINKKDKNKGRIEIEYYSSAELERIVDLFQTIHN